MKKFALNVCFYFCLIGCNLIGGKNEVIQGIDHFPSGINPLYHFGDVETQITSQIYEPLIRLDSDYKTVLPHLAK